MPPPLPAAQLNLRQRFSAMRNIPPFLREIWGTSKPLTIAAIGIRVARGTTLHGFSLNCNCDLRAFGGSALTDDIAVPAHGGDGIPVTYVPARNTIMLSVALGWAEVLGSSDLFCGVNAVDYSGYPDCRDVFVKSMNVTLNLAMGYNFNVETPLMYLTKAQTWELADQLGCLAYIEEHTHTCYMGVPGGCGECPSCKLRNAGQAEYLNK